MCEHWFAAKRMGQSGDGLDFVLFWCTAYQPQKSEDVLPAQQSWRCSKINVCFCFHFPQFQSCLESRSVYTGTNEIKTPCKQQGLLKLISALLWNYFIRNLMTELIFNNFASFLNNYWILHSLLRVISLNRQLEAISELSGSLRLFLRGHDEVSIWFIISESALQ